jgi:hypothetical protein
MMDKIMKYDTNVLLMGDFNIDLMKPQHHWESTLELFGLSQLINEPTRITDKSSTLIDHIYTNNVNIVSNAHVSNVHLSDHCPIICSWSCKIPAQNKGHTFLQYRTMKKLYEQDFLDDLSNVSYQPVFDSKDPDSAF